MVRLTYPSINTTLGRVIGGHARYGILCRLFGRGGSDIKVTGHLPVDR